MKTVPAALPAAEKLEPEQIKKLYENSEIDLVCVLGPTASGKTRYAVELARKIGAENTYLTHLAHALGKHEDLESVLPEGIHAAYDGLVIESN